MVAKSRSRQMEHFVTMVKKTNESDWINRLINPYLDLGANCRFNITQEVLSSAHEATTLPASVKRNHTKNIKMPRKPLKKPRIKRQITSSGTQVRGGQSCLDRHTPMRADPETYHESAHCLVFSELWYNVYRLKTPFISHSTSFRLFDKNTFEAGHSHWEDLTKGMHINIGTFNRHIVNHKDDPTLVFTYTPLSDIRPDQFCLDPQKTTLLIPRPLPKESIREFPQILDCIIKTKYLGYIGGPEEYLLVRSEDITFDGDDCDKAGVGFKAFAKQPARCDNLRGTCLANQPAHLWKQDIVSLKALIEF
uniref:HAP2-GCS1 domain-containing protein n=1 Tax=Rhodnius prolixus TaxID=13249 RepID=T1HSQ8_RHOPR